MRTTVHLPDALLERAREKAAREKRTLTSLIEEGLRIVVAERHEKPTAPRIMPRVSRARGRLPEGVDLVQHIKDIEEANDREQFGPMPPNAVRDT